LIDFIPDENNDEITVRLSGSDRTDIISMLGYIIEKNSTYYLRFYSSEKAAAIGNYRFNISYTLDEEYDTKEESSEIKLNKKIY
jgi:hypothetical protein